MSIHPSLVPTKGKKHRSVLKRYERIDELKKQEKWKDGDSTFGVAKSRIIKIKLKKTKSAEAKTPEATKAADAKNSGASTGKPAAAKPASK